jgi:hypothetical protein
MILFSLLSFSWCCFSESKAIQEFNIIVTIYVKGNYKLWEYSLNQKQITITKYTTNYDEHKIVFQKELTKSEAENLSLFLKKFPFSELKEKYVNEKVEGEHHFEFYIKYEKQEKKIYVYFEYQKDLNSLMKQINKLTPYEFRLSLE